MSMQGTGTAIVETAVKLSRLCLSKSHGLILIANSTSHSITRDKQGEFRTEIDRPNSFGNDSERDKLLERSRDLI